MELVKVIFKVMFDICKELNKCFIEFLIVNIQVNQYDNVDDNIVIDIGNCLKFDLFLWSFEIFVEFCFLVNNNKIFDFIYLNGCNLFIDKDLVMYCKLNFDQKDQDVVFNDFDIYWDIKNFGYLIDSVFGCLFIFIVNLNQIFFWNMIYNIMVFQFVDLVNNCWVYVMVDFEFCYNDNGVMCFVLYEVEYVKVCIECICGCLVWNYIWFVCLYGGLDVGFIGLDDIGVEVYIGIMEIVVFV